MLKPLGCAHQRLMFITSVQGSGSTAGVFAGGRSSRNRTARSASAPTAPARSTDTPERPRRVNSTAVAWTARRAGVAPRGRLFRARRRRGAEDVAVISHDLAERLRRQRRRYQRCADRQRPDADRRHHAAGLRPAQAHRVFLPLTIDEDVPSRSGRLHLVGRLKDGVSPQQAAAISTDDRSVVSLSDSAHSPASRRQQQGPHAADVR